MGSTSEYMQEVSVKVDSDQIAAIRRAHEIINQTDDQIATGVVVSYLERCRAKPHLSICSYAYTNLDKTDKNARITITLTEGQWKLIDDLCTSKRTGAAVGGRGKLIRWIIADTAEQLGYPR